MKPTLTLVGYTRDRLSGKEGFTTSQVTFRCDVALQAFSARATRAGSAHGVGIGDLLCSMEDVAAGEEITFSLSAAALTQGDGEYRVSLYGKANDVPFDFGDIDFAAINFAGETGEWSE